MARGAASAATGIYRRTAERAGGCVSAVQVKTAGRSRVAGLALAVFTNVHGSRFCLRPAVFVESVAARVDRNPNKRAPNDASHTQNLPRHLSGDRRGARGRTGGRSVGSSRDLQADRAAPRRSRAAAAGVDTPAVDRRRESRCDGRLRPDDAHAARCRFSARRAAADRRPARHLRDARCRRAAHVRFVFHVRREAGQSAGVVVAAVGSAARRYAEPRQGR